MSSGDTGGARPPMPPASPVRILGVDYLHLRTADAGDLYVTPFGRRFAEQLMPRNWFTGDWFAQNRERLEGTSTVYRVTTRPVGGRTLDLVVKWCRVGEAIPFDTVTLHKFSEAAFNSPYEEFSLVMELRDSAAARIRTHRPMAIYVPSKRLPQWQTGRSRSAIARKKAKHRDVELDIFRQYILMYAWVDGVTITEAMAASGRPADAQGRAIEALTRRATEDLAREGFRVLDMKPAHLIVRPRPDGELLRERDGAIAYALVDFELLERTPEYERVVLQARRAAYLRQQRDRFGAPDTEPWPAHLQPTRVRGVDYVYGHSESTQGALWVVGREPRLFDFFQPERWRRTERTALSETNEVYYTRTKDQINLVWKVSRVGETAEGATPDTRRIRAYGFNSPFEEFAFALELARRGVPTVYPRAIYMTGLESDSDRPVYVQDARRYATHATERTPDGAPALRPDHVYVTVWGYWNGRDEMLAADDRDHCRGVNLAQACLSGYISRLDMPVLLERMRGRLREAGFEPLRLKEDHVLLSVGADGALLREADGSPELRLCNFELLAPRVNLPESGGAPPS